jgi:hypothetical protein
MGWGNRLSATSRIVFHIGLEKTGTDSFQHFCSKNSRVLLRRGILYLVYGLAFAGQNHAPFLMTFRKNSPAFLAD